MSTSKQAYLAAKYMSGAKAEAILSRVSSSDTQKKKKKKVFDGASTASTSYIKDDDAGWGGALPSGANDGEEDVIAQGDAIVASDRSFKKRRTEDGGWETIRVPTPPSADEQPLVVETDSTPLTGGLLSGDQIKRIRGETVAKDKTKPAEAEETVYRDQSGRKIDTKAERAAAAREKRLQQEKEALKMEWGKGLVQREEEEKRRLELEKEKTRGLARYADDEDLNAWQRGQERWNDPAAAFLTKKQAKGPRKPDYTGPPPPPNRFGIKPGYRWDGVDRSNGFEKKLFQHGNERQRRGLEAYEWSVDDM